jgi:hypothetical protein
MTFEADLYAELSSDAGVIAFVGTEIWPSHASEGARPPYIVYTPIASEAFYNLSDSSDMKRIRLQVDCYATDPDTAASIARAVITAIPVTGQLHRTSHNDQDLGMEEDTRLFRRMVELSIFHRSS